MDWNFIKPGGALDKYATLLAKNNKKETMKFITADEARKNVKYKEQEFEKFYEYLSNLIKELSEKNYRSLEIRTFGAIAGKVRENTVFLCGDNHNIFTIGFDSVKTILVSNGFSVIDETNMIIGKSLLISW